MEKFQINTLITIDNILGVRIIRTYVVYMVHVILVTILNTPPVLIEIKWPHFSSTCINFFHRRTFPPIFRHLFHWQYLLFHFIAKKMTCVAQKVVMNWVDFLIKNIIGKHGESNRAMNTIRTHINILLTKAIILNQLFCFFYLKFDTCWLFPKSGYLWRVHWNLWMELIHLMVLCISWIQLNRNCSNKWLLVCMCWHNHWF